MRRPSAPLPGGKLAFLNRETVKYIWKVVPTEIEDRTKIVIGSSAERVCIS